MKSLITVLLLLLCSSLHAQCAWNDNVVGQNGSGPTMEGTECFEVSPLSVVWLESDNCKCHVDIRIIGRMTPCDPTCQSTSFAYSGIGITAGSGNNRIGVQRTGSITPNNHPPMIRWVEEMDVECGSPFVFDFSVRCGCDQTGMGGPQSPTCNSSEAICQFTAMCNQECDEKNTPDNIPVE